MIFNSGIQQNCFIIFKGLSMYWINIIPKGRWSKGMEENNKIIIFHHNIDLFPLGPGQYVKISIMLTIWLKLFPISSMPLICWYKYLFLFVPNFNLSSVQSLNYVRLFATPWITAHQASLSITNTRNLLKLIPIESVMPSSHLILCHPLLLLPPIPPSIRVFSNESTLHMRWPKYWSFSFSNFNLAQPNLCWMAS